VAPYFRIAVKTANEIIERSRSIVRQWNTIATRLAVPAREQERMAAAFQLAA
jgi:serine/threonine-protein kinase HipA